ncbi:MAG: hypothetical protein M1834_003513 [Cirrosporium novae-zelandiae]|nr:MAG: hypothetical protein M1834_003513 [Cirrosporium novae-zelandiae]
MKYSIFTVLLGLIAFASCVSSLAAPQLTPLFTALLSVKPAAIGITVQGGEASIISITGGSISGPALNATVSGGLASASMLNNGTYQMEQIDFYGSTTDETPFFAAMTGTGDLTPLTSRMQLDIGGSYAYLATGYILVVSGPTPNKTSVIADAYLVT